MSTIFEYIVVLTIGGFLCFYLFFPLFERMIVAWTNKHFHKQERRVIPYFDSKIDKAEQGMIDMGFELCEEDDPHAAVRFENGCTIKRIDSEKQKGEYKKLPPNKKTRKNRRRVRTKRRTKVVKGKRRGRNPP